MLNEDYLEVIQDIDTCGREITDWEADFIESMLRNRPTHLSTKQKEIISDLAWKYLQEVIE